MGQTLGVKYVFYARDADRRVGLGEGGRGRLARARSRSESFLDPTQFSPSPTWHDIVSSSFLTQLPLRVQSVVSANVLSPLF